MQELPEFFRRENIPKQTPEEKEEIKEFDKAIERYEKHFGYMDIITEPSAYSLSDWTEIINRCISEDKNVWELFGEEYDPEADY